MILRRLFQGLLGLIGLVALGIVGLVAWQYRPGGAFDRPELAEGLSQFGSEEVTRRLLARYPIGGSAAALPGDLAADHFTISRPGEAERRWGDFVCSYWLYVTWHADGAGRLVRIKGDFESGCL